MMYQLLLWKHNNLIRKPVQITVENTFTHLITHRFTSKVSDSKLLFEADLDMWTPKPTVLTL